VLTKGELILTEENIVLGTVIGLPLTGMLFTLAFEIISDISTTQKRKRLNKNLNKKGLSLLSISEQLTKSTLHDWTYKPITKESEDWDGEYHTFTYKPTVFPHLSLEFHYYNKHYAKLNFFHKNEYIAKIVYTKSEDDFDASNYEPSFWIFFPRFDDDEGIMLRQELLFQHIVTLFEPQAQGFEQEKQYNHEQETDKLEKEFVTWLDSNHLHMTPSQITYEVTNHQSFTNMNVSLRNHPCYSFAYDAETHSHNDKLLIDAVDAEIDEKMNVLYHLVKTHQSQIASRFLQECQSHSPVPNTTTSSELPLLSTVEALSALHPWNPTKMNELRSSLHSLSSEKEWLSDEVKHQLDTTLPTDLNKLTLLYQQLSDDTSAQDVMNITLDALFDKAQNWLHEAKKAKLSALKNQGAIIQQR